MLRTLFFGTPETAVPFLDCLADKSRVVAVLCSPDKPAGRGYEPAPPPVKKAALARGLPVLQPETFRDGAALAAIQRYGPADLGVVVAYGFKIPPAVFSYPRLGLMNVHFSLLPRYRGAAPIQRALMNGETESGVSLFRIEEGLDTGPVYLMEPAKVAPEDNARSLRKKLIALGLDLLPRALRRFEEGPWTPTPQQGDASLAPSLKKEEGLIRWDAQPAEDVMNLIRGTYEWPHAFTFLQGRMLKIRAAEVRKGGEEIPGTIGGLEGGRGFLVQCKKDRLLALRVQPEGKKEMDAGSFWNGARLKVGERFGPGPDPQIAL